MAKSKPKREKITPSVESPTWGNLQRMAEVVLHKLGGPPKAAQEMSYESYYTLCILAALKLDEDQAKAPIFGKRFLT